MKELEDFNWFPNILRQYQTDFIGYVVTRFDIYRPFINLLKSSNNLPDEMFDLCSGSGEPAYTIFKESGVFKQLILSDKFPNTNGNFDKHTQYLTKSTDALNIQFHTSATYTMFNAFHHFCDNEKLEIANSMIATQANGYFVEILAPDFFFALKIAFTTTVGTLLLTPFIKPFSFKRLFFTYILPINILTITYDGLVSVFKSGSVKNYRHLFEPLKENVKVSRIQKGLSSLIIIQIN